MTGNALMKTKYEVPLFFKRLALIIKSNYSQTELVRPRQVECIQSCSMLHFLLRV